MVKTGTNIKYLADILSRSIAIKNKDNNKSITRALCGAGGDQKLRLIVHPARLASPSSPIITIITPPSSSPRLLYYRYVSSLLCCWARAHDARKRASRALGRQAAAPSIRTAAATTRDRKLLNIPTHQSTVKGNNFY